MAKPPEVLDLKVESFHRQAEINRAHSLHARSVASDLGDRNFANEGRVDVLMFQAPESTSTWTPIQCHIVDQKSSMTAPTIMGDVFGTHLTMIIAPSLFSRC